MSVKIKHITLWRSEVENKPGILARTLEPLAAAHTDLEVVMGYRYPGTGEKAAIELYPVTGKKAVAAAKAMGLAGSGIPTLLVTGDNKVGLGHLVAKAIADAGINLGSSWPRWLVGATRRSLVLIPRKTQRRRLR